MNFSSIHAEVTRAVQFPRLLRRRIIATLAPIHDLDRSIRKDADSSGIEDRFCEGADHDEAGRLWRMNLH